MSAIGNTGDATSLAKVLADMGGIGEPPSSRVDGMVREAVAALRAATPAEVRVAKAFDALLDFRYGDGEQDPDGDAGAVVDAVAALDRARTDLYRVLRAWMGEDALENVAPQLEVRKPGLGETGGVPSPMMLVHDDDFRMTVPDYVAGDPVLLMTVFSEEKRRVARLTGGDFGPDAAFPDHFRDCPGLSSGGPEDCTCLSAGSPMPAPRMAVAADGRRFVIRDSDLLQYETHAWSGPDLVEGVISVESARREHGALRELFLPGSPEPSTCTEVWVSAELERDPEVSPFVRQEAMSNTPNDWWWKRGDRSYGWDALNAVPLVGPVS